MGDMEKLSQNIIDLSKSTKDSNKFYSIVLDARASTVSENTCDIAERLLRGETDNAKAALEHLWSLKKIMISEEEADTIDLLIQYYQKKMDVVRSKEEHIRRVSKDSRSLLEDKRKRDVDIATVKQEISDSSKEIKELEDRLEKLKIKEQELTAIDAEVQKELLVNENEIVNGLYEIILSQREGRNPVEDFTEKLKGQGTVTPEKKPESVSANVPEKAVQEAPAVEPRKDMEDTPVRPADTAAQDAPADIPLNDEIFEIDKDKTSAFSFEMLARAKGDAGAADEAPKVSKEPDVPLFPKSLVKTAKGSVIGEYYYNAKLLKNNRHYVFNSRFFLDRLSSALAALSVRPDQGAYDDLLQLIRDVVKRISENKMMHFEVSTSEFLNERTLKELWHNVKVRNYAEAQRYCKMLAGKLEALRPNYYAMLKEQMGRYASE
jgi:hypothetical protein